jgi:hypothetical protein
MLKAGLHLIAHEPVGEIGVRYQFATRPSQVNAFEMIFRTFTLPMPRRQDIDDLVIIMRSPMFRPRSASLTLHPLSEAAIF